MKLNDKREGTYLYSNTLYTKQQHKKWHCFMLLQIDDKIINGEVQWTLSISNNSVFHIIIGFYQILNCCCINNFDFLITCSYYVCFWKFDFWHVFLSGYYILYVVLSLESLISTISRKPIMFLATFTIWKLFFYKNKVLDLMRRI